MRSTDARAPFRRRSRACVAHRSPKTRTPPAAPARRAAASRQPVGIDTELARMGADEADRAAGVGKTLIGSHVVPAFHAVVGAGGDHPSPGQILRLRVERQGIARPESAAEEEDDGRPLVGVFPIAGEEEGQFEVGGFDRLVDDFQIGGASRRDPRARGGGTRTARTVPLLFRLGGGGFRQQGKDEGCDSP